MMTGMLHPMSKKTGSSKSSLFLGDIDLSLDEAGLASLCAPFGSVLMAKVQRSKLTYKSLGYGFVTMSTPEEALRCIEKLDGVMAGDRAMRVSWAERNRVLLVCNLNPTTTLEKVVMYFENYGSIERDACVEGMKGISVLNSLGIEVPQNYACACQIPSVM
jgi:RNA recognition motif-containing protein